MGLIEARGVTVELGGRKVLWQIDFTIERGEIVTVVGPNGSGKSTFVRAMVGAVPPSEGRVTRSPGLVLGYVPQRLSLDAAMPLTVGRFLNLPRHRRSSEVAAMLDRVGVGGLEHRQMSALSGGQFQRALLARALLPRPDLLILDEPTQSLDQPGTAAFYRLIETVRQDLGCAVLMVSHDLHVVMSASDRVLCINGHICCEGTPTVVSAAPEYRALFGTGTHGAFALYQHQHDHHHPESEGSGADA
ncbi:ATP-binding cassette domain-containing protein [Amorphus orientalis]|uniref:Zinc transport system ATP-binding protein n=1 Tax=Amorphus orientalis TaxID=649198 RepID=A0AAE4AUE6_9HYPH|nr:metal ABC transporter ATP-binding protein [Amorphus orientalis]MDQ0317310.1 zinc transport system ATP-binding protein [Amorphus orientalis]